MRCPPGPQSPPISSLDSAQATYLIRVKRNATFIANGTAGHMDRRVSVCTARTRCVFAPCPL